MSMAPEAAEPDQLLELHRQVGEIIAHPQARRYHWRVVEKPAEHYAIALNVREHSPEHAARLAISIAREGQLQECVGCVMPEGDTIFGGLHRHAAVVLINHIETELGKAVTNLRARIREEPFTREEALAIQIAENLHEAMRPEEKAKAIVAVWKVYHDSAPEGEISMAKFANMIGRGVSEVSRAIRFAALDPRVQKLVEMDAVTYSLAVDLARLPQEKQFPLVHKIIVANFDPAQIKRAIKEACGEEQDMPGMFSAEMELELAEENFRLGLKTAADRAARDAAGYFERVLHLLPLTDPKDRERVSDVVKDILVRLINSSDQFRDLLEKQDEWLFRELQTRELLMLPQAKKEAAVQRFVEETGFPNSAEKIREHLAQVFTAAIAKTGAPVVCVACDHNSSVGRGGDNAVPGARVDELQIFTTRELTEPEREAFATACLSLTDLRLVNLRQSIHSGRFLSLKRLLSSCELDWRKVKNWNRGNWKQAHGNPFYMGAFERLIYGTHLYKVDNELVDKIAQSKAAKTLPRPICRPGFHRGATIPGPNIRRRQPERIRRDLGRKKLNEQFTELSLDEKYIVVMAQRRLVVNGGSGEKAAIKVDGRYHAIMDGLCEKGLFYKRYGEYLPAWVRF